MLPGCDYNHWLIVMEFPKDPAPTREQMIDTYLNTLATVLGRYLLSLSRLTSKLFVISKENNLLGSVCLEENMIFLVTMSLKEFIFVIVFCGTFVV